MGAAEAQSEPTMEEILASIRRIISEDDAPKADVAEESPDEVLDLQRAAEPVFDAFPEPEPEPEPIPEPVAETVSSDFNFDELPVEDDFQNVQTEEPMVAFDEQDEIIAVDREPEIAPEALMEFDTLPELAPVPKPEPVFEESAPPPIFMEEPEPAPQMSYQPKIVPPQLEKTIGLIGENAANAASEAFAKLGPAMPGHFASGPSVEELVAYLLKPMLKDWLDKNLPRIVEERVEAELARIARRGF